MTSDRWIPNSTTYTVDPYNGSLLPGAFSPPSPWYPTGVIAIPSLNEFVAGDMPGTYIDGVRYNGSIFVINASTGKEVRAITVGNSASAFAYNPSSGLLFCGVSGDPNSVFMVNLRTGSVVRVVQVVNVAGLVYDSTTNRVYVSNWTGIQALNGTTGAEVAYLPVHWGVKPLVLDPLTDSLWVADSGNGTIYVVNLSTFAVTHRLQGIGTIAFLYDPSAGVIFSSNGNGTTSVLNASSGTLAPGSPLIPVGGSSLALDAARHVVYVGGCGPGVCEFSDTNDSVLNRTLKLANYGWIAFDPESNHLLCYDLDDTVLLFNGSTDQLVASRAMITSFLGAALDPDNGLEYIATPDLGGICSASGTVSVLDPTAAPSLISTLPAGDGPSEVAYDSADHRIFVTNNCGNSVTVIDPTNDTVVRSSLPVGQAPYGIAYDGTTDTVWVANENSQNLTVLNGSTLATVATVRLPQGYPYDLAFDPANDSMFVSDIYGRDVTVLNAASFAVTAAGVATGNNPQGLLYDPQNGDVYVANGGSDNLTVLNATDRTPVASIPTVAGTTSLALDPTDHLLFATDTQGSRIVVVDTLTGTAESPTLPASGNPEGVVYDPATRQVDVPNFGVGAINVLADAPSLTRFTVTPSPAEADRPVSVTAVAVGGSPPYTYGYAGLPPGCVAEDAPAWSCTPTQNGTFAVTATVSDSLGYSATATADLVLLPPLVAGALSITPEATDLGGSVTLTWNLTGGASPFAFTYAGLPPGCVVEDRSSFSCVPQAVGVYAVDSTVTDGAGATRSDAAVLDVNAPLRVTSLTEETPQAQVDATLVLYTAVSGGTGPIGFAYAGLPPGCVSVDSPLLSCTPAASGNFTVTVTATDRVGRSAVAAVPVAVRAAEPAPPPAPGIVAFLVDPSPVTVGAVLTLYVDVTGGQPPLVIGFSGLPPGCPYTAATATTLSCHPNAPGLFEVEVTVTDGLGREARATSTVTVRSAPSGGAVSLPEEGLLGVLGAVGAGAIGAVVWVRRTRRRPGVTGPPRVGTTGEPRHGIGPPPPEPAAARGHGALAGDRPVREVRGPRPGVRTEFGEVREPVDRSGVPVTGAPSHRNARTRRPEREADRLPSVERG